MQQVGKEFVRCALESSIFHPLRGNVRSEAALGSAPSKAEVTLTVSLISTGAQIRISNQLLFYLQMRKTPVGNAVFLLLKIKMKKKKGGGRQKPAMHLSKKKNHHSFKFYVE